MPLFRLIYCSRATLLPQTLTMLCELQTAAQSRNVRAEITGLLCYGKPYFFQCLEGPQLEVSRTMRRIFQDIRHTDIVLIDARVVGQRLFPNWSMRFVVPSHLPEDFFKQLFKDMANGSLPDTGDQLMGLMQRLADWAIPCTSPADDSVEENLRCQGTRMGITV